MRRIRPQRIAAILAAILSVTNMNPIQAATKSFVVPISISEEDHGSYPLRYRCVIAFAESEGEILDEPQRETIFAERATERAWRIGTEGFLAEAESTWFFRKSSNDEIQPCTPESLLDNVPTYRWELKSKTTKSATFRIITRRCGDHLYLGSRIRLGIVRVKKEAHVGISLADLPKGKKYPCVRRAIDLTIVFRQSTGDLFDIALPWRSQTR